MEEAKPVKSKKAGKPRMGVKVLKTRPGKTSLSSASKTKRKSQADAVAISEEKTTKKKHKTTVKTTKSTRNVNEAEGTEAENKLEATKTKETKEPETAKNIQETRTVKKTKQNTIKLGTTAGTSEMKVKKKKSTTVKKTQKSEVSNKKLKMIDEVYEAITINAKPRKGASSQAIKRHIFSKLGIENEDANHKRINGRINQILRQAVESGDLARPAASKGSVPGASAAGRFMLAKKVTKPKVAKKQKVEEDAESNE